MDNFITVDGRRISFQSAVDPVREAERYLASFDPARTDLVILFGLTTAAFLPRLLASADRAGRRLFVLCVDPDGQMKTILDGTPEGLSLANRRDLWFCSLQDTEKIRSRIEYIFYHEQNSPLRLQIFRNPSVSANFRDAYAAVERTVQETVRQLYANFLVMSRFRRAWVCNILKNTARAAEDGARIWSLAGLRQIHKDQPALIVCAGPSLDGKSGLLKAASAGLIVICVDTALKPLLKAGVRPDYVVSLDSQPENLRDFTGLDTRGLRLVLEVSAHRKIAEIFKGDIFLFQTDKILTDPETGSPAKFVEPHYRLFSDRFRETVGLQSGGSVSSTALDLALFMGCSKIYFVGQDLAFSGYRTYCKGTYQETVLGLRTSRFRTLDTILAVYILGQAIKRRITWKGVPAVSTFVLETYREWFETAMTVLQDRIFFIDSPFFAGYDREIPAGTIEKKGYNPVKFVPSDDFNETAARAKARKYLGDMI